MAEKINYDDLYRNYFRDEPSYDYDSSYKNYTRELRYNYIPNYDPSEKYYSSDWIRFESMLESKKIKILKKKSYLGWFLGDAPSTKDDIAYTFDTYEKKKAEIRYKEKVERERLNKLSEERRRKREEEERKAEEQRKIAEEKEAAKNLAQQKLRQYKNI